MGDYLKLKPARTDLVRGNVYPVPDPALPFLGVHFTPRMDGSVWLGPNAVFALAREGYALRDVDPRDLAETLAYPGFRPLARPCFWRTAAGELYRDVSRRAFVAALQRYVPELAVDDCVSGPSGVRAQALDADGALVDDFVFYERRRGASRAQRALARRHRVACDRPLHRRRRNAPLRLRLRLTLGRDGLDRAEDRGPRLARQAVSHALESAGRCAPGIARAKSTPIGKATSGSSVPWTTAVGTRKVPSQRLRLPDAMSASNCRDTPSGWMPRAKLASPSRRVRSVSNGK